MYQLCVYLLLFALLLAMTLKEDDLNLRGKTQEAGGKKMKQCRSIWKELIQGHKKGTHILNTAHASQAHRYNSFFSMMVPTQN